MSLVFAACGPTERLPPEPPEVPAWIEALPELELPSRPATTLGGFRQTLQRPEVAMVSGDSVLVVLDRGTLRIWSLPLDGRGAARSWGGRGRGPGELQALEGGVGPEGRLWIWDAGQMRVSLFDLRGELLDDFALWSELQAVSRRLGPARGACLRLEESWDTTRIHSDGYAPGRLLARCVGDGARSRSFAFVRSSPAGSAVAGSSPSGARPPLAWARARVRATLSALPALRSALPAEAYDPIELDVLRRLGASAGGRGFGRLDQWWGDGGGGAWIGLRDHLVRLGADGEPTARVRRPPGTLLSVEGRYLVTTRPDPVWGGALVDVWEMG